MECEAIIRGIEHTKQVYKYLLTTFKMQQQNYNRMKEQGYGAYHAENLTSVRVVLGTSCSSSVLQKQVMSMSLQ